MYHNSMVSIKPQVDGLGYEVQASTILMTVLDEIAHKVNGLALITL